MGKGSSNTWSKSKEYESLTAECYGGEHTVEFKDSLRRKLDLYKEFMSKGSGYAKASREAWEVTLGEAQRWATEHGRDAADPESKFLGCHIDPDTFDLPRVYCWTAKALGSTAVRKGDCPGPEYWSNYQWAKENPKEFWTAANRIIASPLNAEGRGLEEESGEVDLGAMFPSRG